MGLELIVVSRGCHLEERVRHAAGDECHGEIEEAEGDGVHALGSFMPAAELLQVG